MFITALGKHGPLCILGVTKALNSKFNMALFAVFLNFLIFFNWDSASFPLQSLEKVLVYTRTKLVYHMINVIAFTKLAGKGQAGEML